MSVFTSDLFFFVRFFEHKSDGLCEVTGVSCDILFVHVTVVCKACHVCDESRVDRLYLH